MERQRIESQKGEVAFRKKLYLQQIEKVTVFDNEFDAAGIENVLKDKMKKTADQMTLLQKQDFVLSPYLEIGAERCQRSLVMENDLGLNAGAAADISFDMLKSCDHYRNVFGKAKSPMRICCDANNLPFLSGSIPFVFCYETLHHFPEPTPITREIYRVLLPGGCFFFDEEPYKQVLHINLYKGKKIYSEESLNRSTFRRVLDHFFCVRNCNEAEHGIIENEDITLQLWKQALTHFDAKDVKLIPFNGLASDLFQPNSYLKYFAAYSLGGNISGICRKAGMEGAKIRPIHDVLICPSCREKGSENLLNRKDPLFVCPECSKTYPVVDQVLFLLSYDRFAELYPQIFDSFRKK